MADAIKARRWKTIERASSRPRELRNIIIEGMVEGKRNAGRRRNSYMRQIKNDAKNQSF